MERAWGATAEDQSGEKEDVHQREEGEDDPEIEQEVLIERGAMTRGVDRQMPEAEARRGQLGRGHNLYFKALWLLLPALRSLTCALVEA